MIDYANLAVVKLAWFGLGICSMGILFFSTLWFRQSIRKSVNQINQRKEVK